MSEFIPKILDIFPVMFYICSKPSRRRVGAPYAAGDAAMITGTGAWSGDDAMTEMIEITGPARPPAAPAGPAVAGTAAETLTGP